MNLERLPPPAGSRHGYHRYARMPPQADLEGEAAPAYQERELERRPEVLAASASASLRVPDELPRASIVAVSRPDAGDITPMLLSYTIEVHYKQFRWRLYKKASQVLYLHFALKRREFLEEFHEKQEQISIRNSSDALEDLSFLKGQPVLGACCRTNVGGFHITNFLGQLLSLKYPYRTASITWEKAEELKKKHCYIALDYMEELRIFKCIGLRDVNVFWERLHFGSATISEHCAKFLMFGRCCVCVLIYWMAILSYNELHLEKHESSVNVVEDENSDSLITESISD